MDEFRFDMDVVDPEAGIPANQYGSGLDALGTPEGPMQGSGEGHAPRMQRMDYYQQLGSQLRSALQGPQQAPQQQAPSLTSGFNQDWLGQALAAGSANGAHL